MLILRRVLTRDDTVFHHPRVWIPSVTARALPLLFGTRHKIVPWFGDADTELAEDLDVRQTRGKIAREASAPHDVEPTLAAEAGRARKALVGELGFVDAHRIVHPRALELRIRLTRCREQEQQRRECHFLSKDFFFQLQAAVLDVAKGGWHGRVLFKDGGTLRFLFFQVKEIMWCRIKGQSFDYLRKFEKIGEVPSCKNKKQRTLQECFSSA